MPARKNLTPADSLWLAILEKRADLRKMSSEKARHALEEGGFPETLIKAYLATRKESASSRTKLAESAAT